MSDRVRQAANRTSIIRPHTHEEIFRDGQSCRTERFSDIRARIAEAHIRELRKAMAAITSDAKRLKTDAPVASKTDDAPIDKAAVDGTAVTGGTA